MRNIFTSIDIGTDNIKIIVSEKYNGMYNVLASTITPSKGLKKGLIVDAREVATTLKKAIKEVEVKLGMKITKALAIVPANNVEIVSTSANLIIKEEENVINGNQIFSCIQRAMTKVAKQGMEVVSVFPKEFVIDKNTKTKNPLGKKGNDLTVKAVATLVPRKNVYSVVSVIESLGIEVMDISIGATATYYVEKSKELDSKNVAIIDIGAEKTEVSVFKKGLISDLGMLPVGSKFIDGDISKTYNISMEEAKEIKEKFAVCNRKYADAGEIYKINDKEINQYELSELIETRIIDLLKNVKIQLNNLTNDEIGYIMVVGGVTQMLGFNATVEDVFLRNATVLNIGIVGIRNNSYSESYGVIKYFCDKLELRNKEYTMFSNDDINLLLSTKRKTNNTISKIFGKLFD